MIGCIDQRLGSKDEFDEFDCVSMINFKIFFEYSFKSTLDEVKQIILWSGP